MDGSARRVRPSSLLSFLHTFASLRRTNFALYNPVMFVSIINDCNDDNAAGRLTTRVAALFDAPTNFIGVPSFSDLSAAGNLVDILDAGAGKRGVVLVNVAPRHTGEKAWVNGTPFGYFWFGETLVVSTVGGFTLSLANKLGISRELFLLDIHETLPALIQEGIISQEAAQRLTTTQFRSLHFAPYAARALLDGVELSSKQAPLARAPQAPRAVWWIDNFGNAKTTLLPEDVAFAPGSTIETQVGSVTCFARLKDVPKGEIGSIVGSSGLRDRRFLEIVKQGGSAAEDLGLKIGDNILA